MYTYGISWGHVDKSSTVTIALQVLWYWIPGRERILTSFNTCDKDLIGVLINISYIEVCEAETEGIHLLMLPDTPWTIVHVANVANCLTINNQSYSVIWNYVNRRLQDSSCLHWTKVISIATCKRRGLIWLQLHALTHRSTYIKHKNYYKVCGSSRNKIGLKVKWVHGTNFLLFT